uniref:Uncharacterized protein n=1 Tax=Romanomermis culicivorax TaxID=13658 RepID=A0A915JHW7_ROMCU
MEKEWILAEEMSMKFIQHLAKEKVKHRVCLSKVWQCRQITLRQAKGMTVTTSENDAYDAAKETMTLATTTTQKPQSETSRSQKILDMPTTSMTAQAQAQSVSKSSGEKKWKAGKGNLHVRLNQLANNFATTQQKTQPRIDPMQHPRQCQLLRAGWENSSGSWKDEGFKNKRDEHYANEFAFANEKLRQMLSEREKKLFYLFHFDIFCTDLNSTNASDYNFKRVIRIHKLDQWFKGTFSYWPANP